VRFSKCGSIIFVPALVTDKAKRVEPVPSSKGIKKAPRLLSLPGLQVRPVVSLRHRSLRRSDFYPKAQTRKWLSKKYKSLSKKRHSRRLPVLAARDLKNPPKKERHNTPHPTCANFRMRVSNFEAETATLTASARLVDVVAFILCSRPMPTPSRKRTRATSTVGASRSPTPHTATDT
jgi:hypothetical protein